MPHAQGGCSKRLRCQNLAGVQRRPRTHTSPNQLSNVAHRKRIRTELILLRKIHENDSLNELYNVIQYFFEKNASFCKPPLSVQTNFAKFNNSTIFIKSTGLINSILAIGKTKELKSFQKEWLKKSNLYLLLFTILIY